VFRNPPAGRPMEILLVEDSLVDARYAICALEGGGVAHRLTLIRDGEEALEFLRRRGKFSRAPRPDVVLLDLRLPKLDGLDVLRAMRENVDLRQVPVVIMTSSHDEEDLHLARHHGVDCYIVKPFDLEQFREIVRQLKHAWQPDVILPVA
jgi:chemotaxis family two-component system response regulator Rcp1